MKKLAISLLVAGSLVLPAAYAADTKMKGQETTTTETMHTETETTGPSSEKGAHHANHHKHRAHHNKHHNKHHGKKHHAKKHRHHTSERCGGPRCDGSTRCR